MKFDSFEKFFLQATSSRSFPYQYDFATGDKLYQLIHAPTGSGKTATAVLGWLWRRKFAGQQIKSATPRRLAYCLPMRVLVEQTSEVAIEWLKKLGLEVQVDVHVLMGGEETDDWDLNPEKDAILIGTQDMLLSRALNRGYGMSRFRWPMHFGLLNSDCLWVLDEIQLMGVGLATSAQLQAFREKFSTIGPAKTVWMSATLRPQWLETVDFCSRVPDLSVLRLTDKDYEADGLRERWTAKKTLNNSELTKNDDDLAAFIKEKHQANSITLVVVNTVNRSRDLFTAVNRLYKPPSKGSKQAVDNTETLPEINLIHSRFRPIEREAWMHWLKEPAPPEGRIVISTQVVEAGVDMSARTLITELAPWPSLVQRFGRCNRRGEYKEDLPAQIYWIDVPAEDDKGAAPYRKEDLAAARKNLKKLEDGGLESLHNHSEGLSEADKCELFPYDPAHVLRRRDFIDLFDTTADLAGNDIDVSRFIREGEELDVQVFWRDNEPNPDWSKAELRRNAPRREELCSVGFVAFRKDFLSKNRIAYRWDSLEGRWRRVARADAESVLPGQVFWIPANQGGYDRIVGWDPSVKTVEEELLLPVPIDDTTGSQNSAYDDDEFSIYQAGWQTIAQHTQEVVAELDALLKDLLLTGLNSESAALKVAARWHDWGKTHSVFQAAIQRTEEYQEHNDLAKAPNARWVKYERRHFRHELASALGVLTLLRAGDIPADWNSLSPALRDLALYLIGSHHGKVRLSIRSMPNEKRPEESGTLFARGVWDGEKMCGVDLGGGVTSPEVTLDLTPMQLGRGADDSPSWTERMLRLRDDLNFGPLKLAYYESILRAADMRASKKADAKAKVKHA